MPCRGIDDARRVLVRNCGSASGPTICGCSVRSAAVAAAIPWPGFSRSITVRTSARSLLMTSDRLAAHLSAPAPNGIATSNGWPTSTTGEPLAERRPRPSRGRRSTSSRDASNIAAAAETAPPQVCQLMTATAPSGPPPRTSSAGVNVLPMTAGTPSVSKKFPLANEPGDRLHLAPLREIETLEGSRRTRPRTRRRAAGSRSHIA